MCPQVAIETELAEKNLQPHPTIVKKTIQLFETKATRHGNMIVGRTGSGKTVSYQTLARAMTRLYEVEQDEAFQAVKIHVINPKSISDNELYGTFDLQTNEWTDGILSVVMRNCCRDESPKQKWIMLDGPVDTLWIESMNTVLDDNKMLTLTNGERIAMPSTVSLLFEVQDLAVASPATVSRCGMVYYEPEALGWEMYMQSYVATKQDEDLRERLQGLFMKYVPKVLEAKHAECREPVQTGDLNCVQSLINLFDTLATQENGVNSADGDTYGKMLEMWFAFSVVWSLGAGMDDDSRKKIDMHMREIDQQFPSKATVYDYFIDTKNVQYLGWDTKVPQTWRPLPHQTFSQMIVPTIDTVRNEFVIQTLIRGRKPVLVTGGTGTGKTCILESVCGKLPDTMSVLTINFSAQTSSNQVQNIIESRIEKRTTNVFAPPGGKKMVCMIDDLNMPGKDKFGSQPPIELLRHWIDHGFWFDRKKQLLRYVVDVQMAVAMGYPGGGRNHMTPRMQSRFNLLNFVSPSDAVIAVIFSSLLKYKLSDFDDEIKPVEAVITSATVSIFRSVSADLLPTPSKCHYLFSLRDLSRIVQGCLRAHKEFIDTKDSVIRLWVHELFRVFYDRLNNPTDKKWFRSLVDHKLVDDFESSLKLLFKNGMTPFGDFMREGMENPPYEEITDEPAMIKFLQGKMEEYNMEKGVVPMHLVLFKDALEHVCRILRIIRMPRGHALLVGVGGSGRSSLTRLAAYCVEMDLFQIEITRQYRQTEFRDDMKKLFERCGIMKKHTVFLFSDTQIVIEGFLEDVNNMLSAGEVPNMYAPEDLQAIRDGVRNDAKAKGHAETPEALYQFFIDQAREYMHIVVLMSPIGDGFQNRVRMFPGLVNSTTCDWFSKWPDSALREVALHLLEPLDQPQETKAGLAEVLMSVHETVVDMSSMMFAEVKRHNYVTPTNYLEMVAGYMSILAGKTKVLTDSKDKLANGLQKLEDARLQVRFECVFVDHYETSH